MADDFRVNIKADLDANDAEKKLAKLTKDDKKVKITAEVDGSKTIAGLTGSVNNANKSVQNLNTSFKNISTTKIKYDAFRLLEQQCKNAVQSVKGLNDAMTLVSMTMPDMTNDGLQNLANQSLQMAKELSTYSKTVTDAVTIYANANETASGILTKAQPTVLLASASGMSASNAADTIQGVLNQFDMTEERAMEVADVVEKLSSEISVDFSKGISDISSAIKNSGSVVNEAGMSFEKYAAIVSSTAEKTRENGSVLGNAYKTIFSRISRSKDGETTDAEKSKAEEALASVGVSVRGMNGDLRDVSDTLDDLNAVWGTLTRSQKSYIAEQAAGTRQKSIFIATMDNYNRALELEKKAVNSSGTAMEINEKRVDSIDGKMQKLSATMTEMYNDAFSDEMIKGLLDFATALVEVADNFGLLQGALAAVGAGAMANTVGRIVANWGTIAAFFTNPITIGAGVVGGIVAVASAYKNSVSEMVDSAKQAGDAWEESNSSIQSNIEKITDLRTALDSGTLSEQEAYDVKSQLLEIQSSLTEAYGLESGSLDLVNGKYDEQIAKLKELADVQANQFLNENRDGIKTAKKKMTENQQYELGEVWTNSEEFKGIKEIVDKYSDKGITGEDYNGTYRIKFEGDATQAESVLQSFATDVRAFQQEVGESGTTEFQDDNGNARSLSIPSKYKKLVQNGTFSVEDMDTSTAYGKALAEAVQKYQEYYEAAQDCRRAVQELRTEQYEAFQELMNIPTEEAEKKIDKLERKLKSLTAVQSTTSMGGSAIAQLQKLTKANNPEVKKTTDALKKAQDAQVKTATAKSTAAKEKSSANKILQNAKTSTLKSGANLSKDAKKATNTYANALKNATKKGVSSSIVSAVNSAIKKRQPISSSLLKKLKGSALKAAKDYNAKLKQEQTINKSVSSSKSVSTKGLTGQLLKDAQKYNKDAKAQASAQKVYDKAVSNYNSATSKDNVAKQKVENATLAKKNAENATTQEQRTLINAQSDQASYIYQNKFLDQQLSVAKSENSARQTALDKATKNAENAQKKKQQQTAKIQKQATALLKNKSVTKALNDTQKAALKAGKTVSTTGITNPAVLKKIKAYNDMVKQGTVLNTQYTIAIEAQSEAVANAAEAEAEYAEMIVENEKQKFENIQNYYNGISDYNQKLSESYAGNRNIKSAKGQDLTEKDYQDEIASRQ